MNFSRQVEAQQGSGQGLSNIRVLDLGRYIAAPLCAQLLSNEGAEVIRVEPPEGASDREVMPIGANGRGGLYLQMNSNKKSLSLDYSKPAGREVLEKLIKTCDVLIVNLPQKALKQLKLDYESLVQIKPDIILTTISAFDSKGSARDRVGFDGTGQALSGSMHLTGTGERPLRAAVSYVDYATGISAAFATMSALIEKMKTGKGQHVQTSLFGTALTMMNPMLMEEATGFRTRKPIANRSPIAGPSDLFHARDGWLMVQVIGDPMFKRWTELVGRPEFLTDPRFAGDSERGENGEELSAIMSAWCGERTVDECLAELEAKRLPACRCLTPKQALSVEGFDDYVETITLEDEGLTVPLVARAIHTAAADRTERRLAPLLGENTQELLAEIGLVEEDLNRLQGDGIILVRK